MLLLFAYQSLFIQEILQEKDNLQKRALGLKICRFQQYVLEASKSASAKSLRVHVPDASVLTNSLVRTMFIIIQRISNIGLLISSFISNLCMIRVQSVYNYYPTLCIYKVAQPSYVLYTIHCSVYFQVGVLDAYQTSCQAGIPKINLLALKNFDPILWLGYTLTDFRMKCVIIITSNSEFL